MNDAQFAHAQARLEPYGYRLTPQRNLFIRPDGKTLDVELTCREVPTREGAVAQYTAHSLLGLRLWSGTDPAQFIVSFWYARRLKEYAADVMSRPPKAT